MRGEYPPPAWVGEDTEELPPRARRILPAFTNGVTHDGTTSACAENTKALVFLHPSDRNYLRVRGEYPRESCRLTSAWELPPRARRILPRLGRAFGIPGTTSACAENTCCNAWIAFNPRNYLRVRGEYAYWGSLRSSLRELPPRARRIPGPAAVRAPRLGTTSACAENTFRWVWCPAVRRNYLRVRGEYSPRVGKSTTQSGTTSACAENTPTGLPSSFKKRNYLRVRGEYF